MKIVITEFAKLTIRSVESVWTLTRSVFKGLNLEQRWQQLQLPLLQMVQNSYELLKQSHSLRFLNFVSASAVGDCNGDSFRATAPQLGGTPIICGFNTGQHGKNH